MKTYALGCLPIVMSALAAAPALAQDEKAAEVTPFIALGSIGTATLGVAVAVPITSIFAIETEVGYRRAEGRIHALSTSASLLYSLPRVGRVEPYLAAGVGLAQYGAPIFSPDRHPIATQSRMAVTVNAGGGLKARMDDKLDMRTDARWFKSFGRDGAEQFRVAQGIAFDVGKR
jgi:opacity protein-like surface antigen